MQRLMPVAVLVIVLCLGEMVKSHAATLVYVSNNADDSVSIIDTATNTVIKTFSVQDEPVAIRVHPNGTRVYVGNHSLSSSVSVIETATHTIIAMVPVGQQPLDLAIHPNGTRLYTANEGSNNVSVINTATAETNPAQAVITNIPAETQPSSITINPSGTRVYVGHGNSNNLLIIDTATNTVIARVPIGPSAVAMHPDGTQLYVASGGILYVMNPTQLESNPTDPASATIDTLSRIGGPTVDPDGSRVYLINACASCSTIDIVTP